MSDKICLKFFGTENIRNVWKYDFTVGVVMETIRMDWRISFSMVKKKKIRFVVKNEMVI